MSSPLSPCQPTFIGDTDQTIQASQLQEIITWVGKSFPHIPCAVTGLAAMVYHGFDRRLPREVSVSFPVQCHDVVRSWALTTGFKEVGDLWDTFDVPLSDCQIRRIKVRFCVSSFDRLSFVEAGDPESPAKIIDLPTVIVETTKRYSKELLKADLSKQCNYAGDICWALKRMATLGLTLGSFHARDIVQHQFWEPFTLSFPAIVPMFTAVGLGPDRVEAVQNEIQQEAEIQFTLTSPASEFFDAVSESQKHE